MPHIDCFFRDRRGNIALIFGLMAPLLIVAVGGAVDYTKATATRAQMQEALDATVLVAGNRNVFIPGADKSKKRANEIYAINSSRGSIDTWKVTRKGEQGRVDATATYKSPAHFLSLMGK